MHDESSSAQRALGQGSRDCVAALRASHSSATLEVLPSSVTLHGVICSTPETWPRIAYLRFPRGFFCPLPGRCAFPFVPPSFLLARMRDELPFRVVLWDEGFNRLLETLAAAGDFLPKLPMTQPSNVALASPLC
jgi:hypothetical protein